MEEEPKISAASVTWLPTAAFKDVAISLNKS